MTSKAPSGFLLTSLTLPRSACHRLSPQNREPEQSLLSREVGDPVTTQMELMETYDGRSWQNSIYPVGILQGRVRLMRKHLQMPLIFPPPPPQTKKKHPPGTVAGAEQEARSGEPADMAFWLRL